MYVYLLFRDLQRLHVVSYNLQLLLQLQDLTAMSIIVLSNPGSAHLTVVPPSHYFCSYPTIPQSTHLLWLKCNLNVLSHQEDKQLPNLFKNNILFQFLFLIISHGVLSIEEALLCSNHPKICLVFFKNNVI